MALCGGYRQPVNRQTFNNYTPRLSNLSCTIITSIFGNLSSVKSSIFWYFWPLLEPRTFFLVANFGAMDGGFMIIIKIVQIPIMEWLELKLMRDQRLCVHCFLQLLRKYNHVILKIWKGRPFSSSLQTWARFFHGKICCTYSAF